MSKVKITIMIVLILGILGFLIYYGLNVSKDLKSEKDIKSEIEQIMTLQKNKNENKEQIDLILNRKLTKDGYLKVEVASKNYLKDLYSYIDNINYLASSETVNYLSAENIKKERDSDFTISKQNISDNKNQISDNINKLIDLTTNDKLIMSYLDTNDLKEYYVKFYKEIIGDLTKGLDSEYINNKYGFLIKRLEIYEKAINFLIENKKDWGIMNALRQNASDSSSGIEFYSEDVLKEYNAIIEELQDATNNIRSAAQDPETIKEENSTE